MISRAIQLAQNKLGIQICQTETSNSRMAFGMSIKKCPKKRSPFYLVPTKASFNCFLKYSGINLLAPESRHCVLRSERAFFRSLAVTISGHCL